MRVRHAGPGPQEPAGNWDDSDDSDAPLPPRSNAAAAIRSRGAARRGTALAEAWVAMRRDARRTAAAEAAVSELQHALAAARERLRRAPRPVAV